MSVKLPIAFVNAAAFASLGLLFSLAPAWSTPARAEEALIAVAANFAEVIEELEAVFESSTGHDLIITTGSTGTLYAQVTRGAPFDALLAADRSRTQKLEDAGFTVPGSRFTYAVGRLVLWSPDPEHHLENGLEILKNGDFRHIAIANPELAPYGLAARQTMESFGVYETLLPKIVMGHNIGQTFSMVATGNAELGLVAKSYAVSRRNGNPGNRWDVPLNAYDPIRQDAVLLGHGAGNAAASGFLAYLRSGPARSIIEASGYGVD